MSVMVRRRLTRCYVLLLLACIGCAEAAGPESNDTGTPVGNVRTIQGVVSRAGRPVSNASVFAQILVSHDPTVFHILIRTSSAPDGTFRIGNLPPGEYIVAAFSAGLFCPDQRVTLEFGVANVSLTCAEEPAPVPSQPGIYVANADGTGIARLTTGMRPAWSPDGRQIAFERDEMILVIDSGGSNEKRLMHGVQPSWSPDGSRIVFVDSAGIAVMNADGSGVIRLVPDSTAYTALPALSPDGTRIAFVRQFVDADYYWSEEIWVMSANGSQPRRLSYDNERCFSAEQDPAWSPDGSKLAFYSWCHGVGLVNVATTNERLEKVYPNLRSYREAGASAISPDGSRILIGVRWHLTGARQSIYVMGLDGSSPRLLVVGGYHPTWSPDAKRIAFVSDAEALRIFDETGAALSQEHQ